MAARALPVVSPPPCGECQGTCCKDRGRGYTVELLPEEVGNFPEAVWNTAERVWVIAAVMGQCIHLTPDNRCSIYERRPIACREFNCSYGYKCRPDGRHSFFLDDNPVVVALIEKRLHQNGEYSN